MNNKEKLKKIIERKNLQFFLLISTPRSSSTVLSKSLMYSGDFEKSLHEPSFPLRKVHLCPLGTESKISGMYESIFNEISSLKPNSKILVKDMSHWMECYVDEYKELLQLGREPIIFLTRNPILSTESKLRKVLQTFDLHYKESLVKSLAGYLGKKRDKDSLNIEFQREQLDCFAESVGFESWSKLLTHVVDRGDYALIEPLVVSSDTYDLLFSGYGSIKREMQFLDEIGKRYIILDSTILRLYPEEILKKICEVWGLQYSGKMIDWGENGDKMNLGSQVNDYQKVWYERAENSSNIQFPNEKCIDVQSFPRHIARYLEKVDIPLYRELLTHPRMVYSDDLWKACGWRNKFKWSKMKMIDPLFTSIIEDTIRSRHSVRELVNASGEQGWYSDFSM